MCAEARGLIDATPDDTRLHVWENALVALIAVPGLQETPAQPVLEVVFRKRGLMAGVETYNHLVDAYEEMDLAGVELTPRGLARHAFAWFRSELEGSIERATWRTWRGERSVLRYADTEQPIWGHAPRKFRNRPPDRTERLR